MPPHNFDVDLLLPTPDLSPVQENSACPRTKYDPTIPFSGWPRELLDIMDRHPQVVQVLLKAIEQDIANGHIKPY